MPHSKMYNFGDYQIVNMPLLNDPIYRIYNFMTFEIRKVPRQYNFFTHFNGHSLKCPVSPLNTSEYFVPNCYLQA